MSIRDQWKSTLLISGTDLGNAKKTGRFDTPVASARLCQPWTKTLLTLLTSTEVNAVFDGHVLLAMAL